MDHTHNFACHQVKFAMLMFVVVQLLEQLEMHYLAQVEATVDGIALLDGLKVQPGMPVDVVIKSGERTFMSYLLKPLTDKTARAFKN